MGTLLNRGPRPKLRADERGASLLESVVVIPVLLTIGLGVFEFSNLMYHRHLIQTGMRDAARYLAGLPQDVSPSTANIDAARNLALYGNIQGTGNLRVSWWGPGNPGYSFPDPTYTIDPNNGTYPVGGGATITLRASPPVMVRVTTSVQYRSFGYLTGWLRLGNVTINESHEERWIGNR